jgi:hypothetical protein
LPIQAPIDAGYTITPGCVERDIDECISTTPGSPCHVNAFCENLDGTLHAGMYNCICPPGMVGDGVATCDVQTYLTKFRFGIPDTPLESANATAIVDDLYTSLVIPADIERSRVSATLDTYRPDMEIRRRRLLGADNNDDDESTATKLPDNDGTGDDGSATHDPLPPPEDIDGGGGGAEEENSEPYGDKSRRLLGWRMRHAAAALQAQQQQQPQRRQTTTPGTEVTVFITSPDPDSMLNTTDAVDIGVLNPAYTVLTPPTPMTSIIDTAFAPVEVRPALYTLIFFY